MDSSKIFDLQIECNCGANEKVQYFCCENKQFKCEECFVDGAVPVKKFKQGLEKFYKTFLPRVENSFLHLSQTEAAIQSIIKNLRTYLEYKTQMNLIKTILEKDFTLTNISDLMKVLIPFKNLNLQNQVNIDFKFIDEKVLEEIDKKTKLLNQFYMDNFWSAELDIKQFDSLSVDKELSFSGSELIEFENELILCDLENNSLNYLNKHTLVQEYQLNFGKIVDDNIQQLKEEGKFLHQIKKSKDGKFLIVNFFTQFGYIQIPTKKFEIKFSQQVQDEITYLIISDDNTKLFLTQSHGIDIYEISSSKFIKYQCSIERQKMNQQTVPIYAIHHQNKKLYVANLITTISIYDVTEISSNKITLCLETQLNKLQFNNFLNVFQDDIIFLGNKQGNLQIYKLLNQELIQISELQVQDKQNFQNYVMNENFLVCISKTEIKLYSNNGFQQRLVGNKTFENENLQCGQFSDCGTKLYLLGNKLYIILLYLNTRSVI